MRFTGGVYIAAGDVNGDGFADIVCGADAGGGPNVTVFSGRDLGRTRLLSFFPYDPHFTGGVRVAAGDVDGDGVADIVTGAGAGGVRVAAIDRTGTGRASVIAVCGPGGRPDIGTFDALGQSRLDDFFAYDPAFGGGLFVASTAR